MNELSEINDVYVLKDNSKANVEFRSPFFSHQCVVKRLRRPELRCLTIMNSVNRNEGQQWTVWSKTTSPIRANIRLWRGGHCNFNFLDKIIYNLCSTTVRPFHSLRNECIIGMKIRVKLLVRNKRKNKMLPMQSLPHKKSDDCD